MTRKQGQEPFVHRPSPETIRAFKHATAEERLNWLEQARRLVADFVPPEKVERWRRLTRPQQ